MSGEAFSGFRKTARVRSLGTFNASGQIFKAADRSRSYYRDGARKIPFADLLSRVAAMYNISDNPEHFLLEAIRANTTNAPNENNDAFHQAELLRFDTRLGMPVYLTYVGKPHHVNHKTDNPKMAMGVIVDAHYHDSTPPLDNCPRCSLRTAERQNRDQFGMHCRRCGHLVKDEFVEILLGIDAKKNPKFAHGVRSGHLAAGSMGCNCLSTQCNTCGHVAFSRPEFCDHIKAGNKGTLWTKRGGVWTRITPMDVERQAAKRNLRWDPTDFCYLVSGDFEVRKAFEYCQNVIFDEYSRVDQPADPKARQRELFLRAQTDRNAFHTGAPRAAQMEAPAAGRAFVVVRLNGSDTDVYAGESLEGALEAAGVQDPSEARIELMEVQAPDPESACDLFDPSKAQSLNDKEGDVVVQAPPNEQIVIQPPGGVGGPGGPPGAPGGPPPPQSIDDLQQPQAPGVPGAPGPDQQLSPAEMGMLPPGASVTARRAQADGAGQRRPLMRFKNAYKGWYVEVTPHGNARVFTAAKEPILVVRGQPAPTEQARHARGSLIMKAILTDGVMETAAKMQGVFTPRVAQVVDGAIDDMKEFTDKYMHDSVTEDALTDMQVERETPPDSVPGGGIVNMEDVRGKPPSGTQDGGEVDHADGKPKGVDQVTKDDHTDMRDVKRGPVSLGKDTVLEDEMHNHQEKLATLARLGAKIAHKERPNIAWTVRLAALDDAGKIEISITAEGLDPRKIAEKDLLEYWQPAATTVVAGISDAECARRIAAEVAKVEARYKKALAGKEARTGKDAEEHDQLVRQAAIQSFCRCLRVVASRQVAGMEVSPLRDTGERMLATARQIGVDGAGQALAYHGMDSQLARYLAAELVLGARPADLENLMLRSAQLMAKGDAYVLDAESDAQNYQPALPPVTAAAVQPLDENALYAAQTRQAAMQGNFAVASQPAPEAPAGGGFDKRSQIRGAVNGTLVSNTLNGLRHTNNN